MATKKRDKEQDVYATYARYPVRISEETKREIQYLKLDLHEDSAEVLAGKLLTQAIADARAKVKAGKLKPGDIK